MQKDAFSYFLRVIPAKCLCHRLYQAKNYRRSRAENHQCRKKDGGNANQSFMPHCMNLRCRIKRCNSFNIFYIIREVKSSIAVFIALFLDIYTKIKSFHCAISLHLRRRFSIFFTVKLLKKTDFYCIIKLNYVF